MSGRESMRSVLENLPELWSEEQYRSEYDLSSFMKSLATVEKWETISLQTNELLDQIRQPLCIVLTMDVQSYLLIFKLT